jgi:hypothetical protein
MNLFNVITLKFSALLALVSFARHLMLQGFFFFFFFFLRRDHSEEQLNLEKKKKKKKGRILKRNLCSFFNVEAVLVNNSYKKRLSKGENKARRSFSED